MTVRREDSGKGETTSLLILGLAKKEKTGGGGSSKVARSRGGERARALNRGAKGTKPG